MSSSAESVTTKSLSSARRAVLDRLATERRRKANANFASTYKRCRYLHSAFYYRVPKDRRTEFDGRQTYRIGTEREDVVLFYRERVDHPGSTINHTNRRRIAGLMFNSIRNRRREKSISIDDIERMLERCNGFCEVTGIALDAHKLKGEWNPWRPTVDRIDSDVGYHWDNCRIVALAVNLAMSRWGEEALATMARAYVKKHGDKP